MDSPLHKSDVPIAQLITEDFSSGTLDLSERRDAPVPGWLALPAYQAVVQITQAGASPAEIRTFLTLLATLDQARDADRLWSCGARLFLSDPWAFVPSEIVRRPTSDLSAVLKSTGVSQRHRKDTEAWHTVAESLVEAAENDPISRVIYAGEGDVRQLRTALASRRHDGRPRFPYLKGPKLSVMWVRMMAFPGGATVSGLETLPVAVDVNVRRVTEYLGVTDTAGEELEGARAEIQRVWHEQAPSAVGPGGLAGTGAALDPALWFYGKWGCWYCEQRFHRRVPIGRACRACRFPIAGR